MKKRQDRTGAISIAEEAFQTICSLPVAIWVPYVLGTFPFVLGLLYFWNDMSKNAFAGEYCLRASLGMSLLFVWMKAWQSVFSMRVYANVSRQKFHATFSSLIRMVMQQTIFHTTAFFVLPVAALITIPFAWMFAMYQMGLVYDERPGSGIKSLFRENYRIAVHYTKLNNLIIAIFSGFGVFVFFNIGVTLFMAPFLAKALFGYQSAWTMGGYSVLNSTYLLTICCLTYLCLDPVIKTAFALEKFYFQDLKTGTKILADLEAIKAKIPKIGLAAVLVAAVILSSGVPGELQAGTDAATQKVGQAVDPQRLEESIRNVISQREFTWRLPKSKHIEDNEKNGFVYRAVKWCLSLSKKFGEKIGSWIEAFIKWLEKLFPDDKEPEAPKDPESKIKPEYLAAGLIFLIAALTLIVLRQLKKIKPGREQAKPECEPAIPDITNENVMADKLPSEKWVELAFELMEKGDIRTAIRALFLGILAFLSENNLLLIAMHKSNSEYERELFRRAHSKPDLLENFTFLVRTVNQVWYGMHAADRSLFNSVVVCQQRIFDHAE